MFSPVCTPLGPCLIVHLLFGVMWNENENSVPQHKWKSLLTIFSIVIPTNLAGSHFFWTTHVGSYSAVSSRTNTPNPFSGQQQQAHQQQSQQISRKEEYAGINFKLDFQTNYSVVWTQIDRDQAFLHFNYHAFPLASESVQRSTLPSTTTDSTKTPIVQTKIVESSTHSIAADTTTSKSSQPCDECGASIA